MIEEYHFGSITINGTTYNYDLEVRWTGEVLKRRGKESHTINIEDVKGAVDQNPDTIIIGTGAAGVAEVIKATQEFIQERGIKLIIDKTGEAVKTFSIILEESREEGGKQNKVIGLFRLTC